MEKLDSITRFIALLVGMGLVITGSIYAIQLFDTIYNGLQNPATATPVFEQWARFMIQDVEGLEHNENLKRIENVRILATIVIGIGGLILVWISLQLVYAGAKIIALMTNDQISRKLLQELLKRNFSDKKAESADKPANRQEKIEPKYSSVPLRQTIDQ